MKDAEAVTRRWLTECVLALDLCPFAALVLRDDSLRISTSRATDEPQCLLDFLSELDLIQAATQAQVSTSLLVFENALENFENYLAVLNAAQQLLEEAGLEGQFQLASFHPGYQFEGESADAPTNYTNRSPLPVIHILREGMLTQMLANCANPEDIPARNKVTLDNLGSVGVARLWGKLAAGACRI